MLKNQFRNLFRPGAGHMPPYPAGRETEKAEFRKLLNQDIILENLILTGLRGVGKTVLLDVSSPSPMKKAGCGLGLTSRNQAVLARQILL
jgi:hypothetical protein